MVNYHGTSPLYKGDVVQDTARAARHGAAIVANAGARARDALLSTVSSVVGEVANVLEHDVTPAVVSDIAMGTTNAILSTLSGRSHQPWTQVVQQIRSGAHFVKGFMTTARNRTNRLNRAAQAAQRASRSPRAVAKQTTRASPLLLPMLWSSNSYRVRSNSSSRRRSAPKRGRARKASSSAHKSMAQQPLFVPSVARSPIESALLSAARRK